MKSIKAIFFFFYFLFLFSKMRKKAFGRCTNNIYIYHKVGKFKNCDYEYLFLTIYNKYNIIILFLCIKPFINYSYNTFLFIIKNYSKFLELKCVLTLQFIMNLI